MVAWWIVALIYVALTVGYELLRPKPQFDEPTPGSLGDFRFPTIGEGRPLPIVWGTCHLKGPMVTWYGDLVIQAIKKNVKTGLFSSEDVTVGYKYFLGVQLVLCSGEIDEVLQVRFDDRPPAQSSSLSGDKLTLTVDAPNMFGGDESEGGVQGNIDVYLGTKTQDPNDYLESRIGDNLPAWRGVCYAVFRGFYFGTSPYIKNVSMVLRRCPNRLGLGDGDHNINGDANPAAMIHDLLTSPPSENGLGIPAGLLDLDSFRAFVAILASEELGRSMLRDRATAAREVIPPAHRWDHLRRAFDRPTYTEARAFRLRPRRAAGPRFKQLHGQVLLEAILERA